MAVANDGRECAQGIERVVRSTVSVNAG